MSFENRAMTGIRPTGDLTVANYVGAMRPIVEMQKEFDGPVSIFVADLHGLTDQEPSTVNPARLMTVRSLLASGIDTGRTSVYLQSQVENPTLAVESMLERHISVSELRRIPTLKEKLGSEEGLDQATASLFLYPVLMAADIVVQDATHVPVGKDQQPHIEITRKMVRRFNREYGNGEEIFATPELLATESLRILALDCPDDPERLAKMSKSRPQGAILLNDQPDDIAKKVKRATTASPGVMNEVLESHFTLTRALAGDNGPLQEVIDTFERRHLDGEKVMGGFKSLMTDVAVDFLGDFSERAASISDREVMDVLWTGGQVAYEQSEKVRQRGRDALGFVDLFANFNPQQ